MKLGYYMGNGRDEKASFIKYILHNGVEINNIKENTFDLSKVCRGTNG
jgi:hypothetical protein